VRADNRNLHAQPSTGEVRIVHHADGTATVNGVPVTAGPGQDTRDAAYQAAVELVSSLGATGPVPAMSVEPDGAAYRITLYPVHGVFAVEASLVGAAGGVGAVSAFHRVRRAWYRPRLNVSWLAAAAFACVLLSVLATVLLHEDGPSVVSLSVDTRNDAGHSPTAESIGRAIATAPGIMTTASVRALAKKAAAAKSGAPATPAPSQVSVTPIPVIGAQPTTGLPPTSQPLRTSASASPSPTGSSTNAKAVSVTDLSLALVGADTMNPNVAFVATASTTTTAPITLTYSYAGTKGRAPVTETVQLSGRTNYAVAGLFPAQPYCGGPVTMTVSTSPAAKNGSVTESAQPGC
jgi:hypothetical protein